MNSRNLMWLAGGLVVLVALAVLGQRQASGPSDVAQADDELFPDLMGVVDEVTSIEIVGAGNETIATLDRGDDGWTVRERSGYSADLTKVRHTLLSFAEARILEAKTANPELHDRLGVEDVGSDTAGGVAVSLQGPGEPTQIIVGDAAGDYRRYVRRAGENQSYMINRDPEIGETAADWLDSNIIDLASGRVREIVVTHPDGEFVRASKASADEANFAVQSIPEGRSLLYDSVANVIAGVLQNLTLEDVERATDTTVPQTVTELITFDGLRLTVTSLERDDAAWIRIAAASEPDSEQAEEAQTLNERFAGWRYRIPSYKLEQLTRRMDDLLQS
ncbi:MAG: DUF4340 domain-containing protein, partial [Gammaproteobacteria bacterium]|nr:DUF4340 domain-containing protein [Gammaproteobacteria bacterium]